MSYIPICEVKLPHYNVVEEPNHDIIGEEVERLIEEQFLGRKIAIRAIGSMKHNGKSQDELVEIIRKLGYDRYDPNRVVDRYENIENKQIDFFALDFLVKKNFRFFGQLLSFLSLGTKE